ncbi:cystatin-like protein [Colossoma macropomum]|uniref:cystatin-like protein n=1 Tax=Colossoma macropomum TaxID=42526 RepID=UPI0018640197|nr:cystatin-like protein [Colossoma macropomum]
MSAVLKLLPLAAVTLLVSAQGWNNYQSLPDLYRTHIDKALYNANRKFGGPYHVAYESLLPNLKIKDDVYVNVRLMVTTCRKDEQKGFGHRKECVTKKSKTPWIDCVVCKPVNGEELIDCARQMDVKDGVFPCHCHRWRRSWMLGPRFFCKAAL